MTSTAKTPEEYMANLPSERKEPMERLRQVILDNMDPRFHEEMNYGMLGYVVPLDIYPPGYHCGSKERIPLPFINLASQKVHIGFYHMGLYAKKEIHDWFIKEYARLVPTKLDMGKSCIRFKNPKHIPYELMGELVGKMDMDEWIFLYEKSRENSQK
jgi:uncharacterized protein YdhG (YjbR/CyaY superfamily)